MTPSENLQEIQRDTRPYKPQIQCWHKSGWQRPSSGQKIPATRQAAGGYLSSATSFYTVHFGSFTLTDSTCLIKLFDFYRRNKLNNSISQYPSQFPFLFSKSHLRTLKVVFQQLNKCSLNTYFGSDTVSGSEQTKLTQQPLPRQLMS